MKYNRKIALCMLGLITVIGICGNTGHNVQASEEMVDEEVTVFDDEEEQIELEIPESERCYAGTKKKMFHGHFFKQILKKLKFLKELHP